MVKIDTTQEKMEDVTHSMYYEIIHLGKKIKNPNLILGEGNDNPLQYSCLENPMDSGA